jgi:plasmid stability protein
MAERLLRDVEPAIVARLKQRAEHRRRSVEDAHKAIPRDLLLADDQDASKLTFEAYLRTMPDVGTDADFSGIEGPIRDVSLAE